MGIRHRDVPVKHAKLPPPSRGEQGKHNYFAIHYGVLGYICIFTVLPLRSHKGDETDTLQNCSCHLSQNYLFPLLSPMCYRYNDI